MLKHQKPKTLRRKTRQQTKFEEIKKRVFAGPDLRLRDYGDAIFKEVREEMKLSQKELAGRLGLKERTVGHIELGDDRPGIPTLLKLKEFVYGEVCKLADTDGTKLAKLPKSLVPVPTKKEMARVRNIAETAQEYFESLEVNPDTGLTNYAQRKVARELLCRMIDGWLEYYSLGKNLLNDLRLADEAFKQRS